MKQPTFLHAQIINTNDKMSDMQTLEDAKHCDCYRDCFRHELSCLESNRTTSPSVYCGWSSTRLSCRTVVIQAINRSNMNLVDTASDGMCTGLNVSRRNKDFRMMLYCGHKPISVFCPLLPSLIGIVCRFNTMFAACNQRTSLVRNPLNRAIACRSIQASRLISLAF